MIAVQETWEGPRALRLGEDRSDFGWMMFAGVMLLVLGCTNTVEGVAAVSGSDVFVGRAHYLFGDLGSWGWVIWVLGVTQALTACGGPRSRTSPRGGSEWLSPPPTRWLRCS